MEPAVTTVLADSQLTAWDALEDRWFAGLSIELEDRFPGRRRSP